MSWALQNQSTYIVIKPNLKAFIQQYETTQNGHGHYTPAI